MDYSNEFDFILGKIGRGDSGSSRALVKVEGGKLVINYNNDYQGVEINSNKNPLRLLGKVEVSDTLTSKSFTTNNDNISISHNNPYIDFRDEKDNRNIYMMGNKGKLYVDGAVEAKNGFKGIKQWPKWGRQYDFKTFNNGGWQYCNDGEYICGVHKSGSDNITNMKCCSFSS